MSNLYQDAILDAKALRASAMANAKAALEEAFEPKIQEMISKHLSETEAVEEDLEEVYGKEEEGKMNGADHDKMEEADINEQELDEILNQLEEMSEPKEESLNEAEEEGEEEDDEDADEADDEAIGDDEEIEEVTDETKVIEITVGDLKEILRSVMPGEAMPTAEPEGDEAGAEAGAGDEVSLEEILDELANEEADAKHRDPDYEAGHQDPEMEEGAVNEDVLQTLSQLPTEIYGDLVDQIMAIAKTNKDGAMNLANTLLSMIGGGAAIAGARKLFPGVKKTMDSTSAVGSAPKGLTNFEGKDAELKEAKATIAALRRDLQEVNLLNAKYLYMNKLFKGKSLTESQKVRVINALDRATTVTQVKQTYETLKESFETKKQQIKESIGFASKPAGVAPKANIVEAEGFVSRWQKLAGIKK